ncbi:MAG: LPP20 family lipoprotein [Pseudomonadota bacterium]
MMLRWILVAFLAVGLGGCASGQGGQEDELQKIDPITVRVSGYGTYANAEEERSDTRKRLMVRRASQLDAYRNLAERVYGTVIFGSSTVNDFVLRNDSFRSYVDSYVRGARTVAVNEHSDGVVETVMELQLEPAFLACATGVADDQVQDTCPIPMPTYNDRKGDVEATQTRSDSLYYLD